VVHLPQQGTCFGLHHLFVQSAGALPGVMYRTQQVMHLFHPFHHWMHTSTKLHNLSPLYAGLVPL
jgi:hypothetical protein